MNLLFEIKKLKKLTIAFFWLGIGSASQVWPQANEKINAFQKLSQAAFFMQKEQYEQALVALEQLHALDTTLIISWF
ncbi:MAG: hypothetical protein RML72_06465 [Bacteroidia bacterium]|nr:hypothetical protein [Bacteroidia bacterium]